MTELVLSADQSRIGRAALGWSVPDLAAAAGIAPQDVAHLEDGQPLLDAAHRARAAFADAGVTFHLGPEGKVRMKVRTLDGIIETPVTLAAR